MRFHNWLSPVLYIFQGLIVLWDVGAGLASLHFHRYGVAAIDFGGAAFVITVIIFTCRSRRRSLAALANLNRQTELLGRRQQMTPEELVNAECKAKKNLERVIQATGAKPCYGGVILEVGAITYMIRNDRIDKYEGGSLVYNTCYMNMHHLPYDELIASAILLLKRDPSIYDRWRRQDAPYA